LTLESARLAVEHVRKDRAAQRCKW